jgi:long-subunit acyl-CoA synthetase (AMP-forming)
MNGLRTWHADKPLPDFPRNLALMLNQNAGRFGDRPIYQEIKNGEYAPLSWLKFQQDAVRLQYSLAERGLCKNDRVAILSPNREEMLELELAVMSMGAVAVPIFAGYPGEQAQVLVDFCEPKFVVVADTDQYNKLKSPERYDLVIHFDRLNTKAGPNTVSFSALTESSPPSGKIKDENIDSDSICLMMYTSGTMGKPKCVQLTHGNILSQQAAMKILWQIDHTDRFLSYLPWHHSFGGIYEKYSALYNGAVLSLDNGHGKNIDTLLMNWRRVKPTVFFSVPRIFQQLATQVLQNPAMEEDIFHDGLRFIFTAAAPLPKNISDMFESRGIPVYEGWGLTETSPCCTVSDPNVPRCAGVVGKPIPGVALKLTEDGEIFVNGPNVMKGYFRNPEATNSVFSDGGWFATGDIGEFTETGLRLLSRKDRIFKLSNAEKVVPTEVENLIVENCCFLSHAYVSGSGKDYPVALLFPNRAMFSQKPDETRLKPGCDCPSGVKDLAHCLSSCLKKLNEKIEAKYMRPYAAMLLDHELSIEREELTPSMKLAPNVVARVFKARIERLYGEDNGDGPEDVYIINLGSE